MAQIHKNNADSEMILDEFIEYLFMVCLVHTKPAKDDGDTRRKKVRPKHHLLEKFSMQKKTRKNRYNPP